MEKPNEDFFEALMGQYKPDFAFAYGSGVFRQEGYAEDEKPMIDLIFGVNDPRNWHRSNIERNGKDYAATMRWLGAEGISRLQSISPGLFYNTYIDFQGASLKYGVTSTRNLIQDLREWQTLYLAGRMQKPVHLLKTDAVIEEAMQVNYNYAVNTALLLLPEHFDERSFYETVTSLSYMGDSRNGIAENPEKVSNIVSGNIEGFRDIYHGILSERRRVTLLNGGQIEQDTDPRVREGLFGGLPLNLLEKTGRPDDFGNGEEISERIRQGIARVVAGPTRNQTLKGIVSAGPAKAVRYGISKLAKARRRH